MTVLWSGDIPNEARDIVGDRVARIAKRALTKGFPVPKAIFGPTYHTEPDEFGVSTERVGVEITADGALKLGDYTLVGTVAALGDGTPFVTYAPGAERVPDGLVKDVNQCDHCNKNRDRNDTYLVVKPPVLGRWRDSNLQDDDYERPTYKQVGSSCIKDFLGHDPSIIASYLSSVDDLTFSDDEISGWNRNAIKFYAVDDVLLFAARIVTKIGYTSKAKAEEEDRISTGETLRDWLSASPKMEREFAERFPFDADAVKLVNATVTEILNATGGSEWVTDIKALYAAKHIQWRHIGILGSAVILGLRTQERKVTEKLGGRDESHFIGEVGQRLNFTDVTILFKRLIEGDYGTSFLLRMSVNESDDLFWYASWSEKTAALEVGDVINLVGTVKRHELDKRTERETTVLTRCTIK